MIFCVIKFHRFDAIHLLKQAGQFLRLRVGNIVGHDPVGAEGDKFFIHRC